MGPKAKVTTSKATQQREKLPAVSPKKSGASPSAEKGKDKKKGKDDEKISLPVVDGALPTTEKSADPDVEPSSEEGEGRGGGDHGAIPNEMIDMLCSMIAFTVASEFCVDILAKTDEKVEGSGLLDEAMELEKAEKFARENGQITLLYEMYNELFDIKDGAIAKEYIDEEYCLSDIMPSCAIHLSTFEKKDIFTELENGNGNTFLKEDVKTIYGVESGRSYTVFVEQEAAQLARDQERMRDVATTMEGAVDPNAPPPLEKDDGRAMETCSCIYGNPCVDEYGCRNWHERFAVATANGWKGF